MLLCYWCYATLDTFLKHKPGQTGVNFIWIFFVWGLKLLSYLSWMIFLFLCVQLFFFYVSNDSAVILDCGFWWSIVDMIPFYYSIEHFLQLHYEADWLFWQFMLIFHFFYLQNILFPISVEVRSSSNILFGCCRTNTLSKYFIIYIYNRYDLPHVFKISTF